MKKESSIFQKYSRFVINSWQQAQTNSNTIIRRYYRWGENTVCLEFAGSSLISSISPALTHREISFTSSPSLTIGIWDRASTGVALLPDDAPTAFLGSDDPFPSANGQEFNRGICRHRETVSLLDRRAKRGYFWARSPADISVWELSGPLRMILHWWWRPQGLQIVHAAAVGYGGKGVLLVGKGGSGKSTTAFACLRAGMDFLGEDYCLVSSAFTTKAMSLYSTGKLTEDSLTRFPALADMVADLPITMYCEKKKKLFFLEPKFRTNFKNEIILKAILIPEITHHGESFLIPTTSSDGLRSIAPNTLMQLPLSGAADLRQMTQLVSSLPIYRLKLGSDLEALTNKIATLL